MMHLLQKLNQKTDSAILMQMKMNKMKTRTIMLSFGYFKKFLGSICICPKFLS